MGVLHHHKFSSHLEMPAIDKDLICPCQVYLSHVLGVPPTVPLDRVESQVVCYFILSSLLTNCFLTPEFYYCFPSFVNMYLYANYLSLFANCFHPTHCLIVAGFLHLLPPFLLGFLIQELTSIFHTSISFPGKLK